MLGRATLNGLAGRVVACGPPVANPCSKLTSPVKKVGLKLESKGGLMHPTGRQNVKELLEHLKEVEKLQLFLIITKLLLSVILNQNCSHVLSSQLYSGIPHIFKNNFPYFFSTFSILNLRSSIPLLLFIS